MSEELKRRTARRRPRHADAVLSERIAKLAQKLADAKAEADELRAAIATQAAPVVPQPAAQQGEAVARFCPGCGSVGDVPDTYRDCCPDGNKARFIPAALAQQCHDLFQLALSAATPPARQAVALTLDQIGDLEAGADALGLSWAAKVSLTRAVERAHGITPA